MAFFDNLAAIMGSGYQYPNGFNSAFEPYASPIKTSPAPVGGLYGGDTSYAPTSSAFGGIDPYSYSYDKKKGASKLSADVIRAQYEDYKQRFAPIEDYAVGLLRDRGTADGQFDLARAQQSITNAGQNIQGQQERSFGRYGLNFTGNPIAGSNEMTGAMVGAMNQTRFADEERRLRMLGGGGGGPSMGAADQGG